MVVVVVVVVVVGVIVVASPLLLGMARQDSMEAILIDRFTDGKAVSELSRKVGMHLGCIPVWAVGFRLSVRVVGQSINGATNYKMETSLLGDFCKESLYSRRNFGDLSLWELPAKPQP